MDQGDVGAIRPEWAMEPSTNVRPIFPPRAFLQDALCTLCGMPLVNGAPISVCEQGLAHANCGGET